MKFGLIGYPIAHSGSPALFSAFCAGRYAYELIETEDFGRAWETFLAEYKAVNVTMPFKEEAARHADFRSADVERTGVANILVKTARGIEAHNSDCLAVSEILQGLSDPSLRTVAVIGMGGAGKAAAAAALDCGFRLRSYHHDEIGCGVSADIVIYTLPREVDGARSIRCRFLIESNYAAPTLKDAGICTPDGSPARYIGGEVWLEAQSRLGYPLMLGKSE